MKGEKGKKMVNNKMKKQKDGKSLRKRVQERVLGWYRVQGRKMAWRAGYGEDQDPYKVLVSEVMLQQTTVETIRERYPLFMEKFPTVRHLARASEEEVMSMWSGLGYYRRAVALHGAACKIVNDFGGVFPRDKEGIMGLPGVGAYTGGALLSFAFRQDALVKDGNIERVMVRFGGVEAESVVEQRGEVERLMRWYHPRGLGSEWYQALMDVGSGLCRPQKTDCGLCPLREGCRGKGRKAPLSVLKVKKKTKEVAYYVWMIDDGAGRFFMEKAARGGLFGGLWIFPLQKVEMCGEKGREEGLDFGELDLPLVVKGEERCLKGEVVHVLTHRRLRLHVVRASGTLKEGVGMDKGRLSWKKEEDLQAVPVWVLKVMAFAKARESKV